MQPGQKVQHTIVVAPLPGWDGRIPQSLDELFCPRIGCCQTCDCVHRHQGGRVIIAKLMAVECKPISIGRQSLGLEESLQPVAQVPFPNILGPPSPVHRPVHGSAPRVVLEIGAVGVPRRGPRRAVEVELRRAVACGHGLYFGLSARRIAARMNGDKWQIAPPPSVMSR